MAIKLKLSRNNEIRPISPRLHIAYNLKTCEPLIPYHIKGVRFFISNCNFNGAPLSNQASLD